MTETGKRRPRGPYDQSIDPDLLRKARPTGREEARMYLAIRDAINAVDPMGLIADGGTEWAYEPEVRAFMVEWVTGDMKDIEKLLYWVFDLAFEEDALASPDALDDVLERLEPIFAAWYGTSQEPSDATQPVRNTLWPRTPDINMLAALLPPPSGKDSLALRVATVFPEVGPELLGFVRCGWDYRASLYTQPDSRATLELRVKRPVRWIGVRLGGPWLGDPGTAAEFGRARVPLEAIAPWLFQSHIHIVALGKDDAIARIFQISAESDRPESLELLRSGSVPKSSKVAVSLAGGRIDVQHNIAALVQMERIVGESKRAFLHAESQSDHPIPVESVVHPKPSHGAAEGKRAIVLEQISYEIAYFLLPHYAFKSFDRLQQLVEANRTRVGSLLYLMACKHNDIDPDPRHLRDFIWHEGRFDDQRRFMMLAYPEPTPIDLADVPLDAVAEGTFVLAPHFSAIVLPEEAGPIQYFVLGQAPMGGGTTLRVVTDDGTNANLGPGPLPNLATFLDVLKDISRA